MSATPRTDAVHEKINASDECQAEDIITAMDFARGLERELAHAQSRIDEWEKLFETTNPAQAKAEHAAVVLKRQALFNENRQLQEKLRACEASHGVAPAKPDASASEGEHGPGA